MNEHQAYLADLLATPAFVAAMEAALAGRLTSLGNETRSAVRNGDLHRAAVAEGQHYALESVLGVVQSYTKARTTK